MPAITMATTSCHQGARLNPIAAKALFIALHQHSRSQRPGGTRQHAQAGLVETEGRQGELPTPSQRRQRHPCEHKYQHADDRRQPVQVQGAVDFTAQPGAQHGAHHEGGNDGWIDMAPAEGGPGQITGQLGAGVDRNDGAGGHQSRHQGDQKHAPSHADHRGEARGQKDNGDEPEFGHSRIRFINRGLL